MKQKNENKENNRTMKQKFNAFDFVIVLIFIITFSVIGIRIHDKSPKISDTKKFSFTIEIKNVNQDFQNKISIGDEIRDSGHGYFYGNISNLKVKPAQKITEDNNNSSYVLSDIPEKNDIEITVACNANISDDSITIENNPIRIGKLMPLKSKGYVMYGYIIDMETE